MTDPVKEFEPVAFQDWKEKRDQQCWAMCVADCDGDGDEEILLVGQNVEPISSVTNQTKGGWRRPGELRIVRFQPPDKLTLASRHEWTALGDNWATCVCAADVDNDNATEIVIGGTTTKSVEDGSTEFAHLRILVWDGANFQLKAQRTWLPEPGFIQKDIGVPIEVLGAYVESVAAADIDQDGQVEIVCGGAVLVRIGHPHLKQYEIPLAWVEIFDWSQPLATSRYPKIQHVFWDPLDPKSYGSLPVHGHYVTDVACADIDNDGLIEIVTVGYDEYYGELHAWGVKQGDAGLELFRKAKREWPQLPEMSSSGHPRHLRVRVGNLSGEQGVNEIATGGILDLGPYFIPSSRETFRRYDTDMRIWRILGGSFYHVNGGIFQIESPSGHFMRSGCEAIFISDIDGDRHNELLSIHEIMVPRSDAHIYGCIIAWDPKKDWSSAPREEIWKRKTIFGIETEEGEVLNTFVSGIWATDIDHDGRIETILSGYYCSRKLEHGVFAGIVR